MERVINKYFDKMESLEEKVSNDVDSLIVKINIKAILSDPEKELAAAASLLLKKLEDEYQVEAFNLGKKFAEDIR